MTRVLIYRGHVEIFTLVPISEIVPILEEIQAETGSIRRVIYPLLFGGITIWCDAGQEEIIKDGVLERLAESEA